MQISASQSLSTMPRRQIMITFSVVILAVFLAALDQTVIATALPRIVADLGGFTQYTWVSTAYLLCSTVALAITGRLTDMYGRKWFYVGGLSIFIIGSVICGLSQSMLQLIIFRGVQGIGGGMMMANSFTIVADLFPPAERGKYQGLIASVFAVASVVGPPLGGLITDALSWHWIFFINVPLGILVIVLFVRYFPVLAPTVGKHQIDYIGMAALVLAVVPALLAFTWGGSEFAWNSPQIIGMFVFAVLMLAAFILIEWRSPEPIIPLGLFKNRIVAVSQLVTLFSGIGMFGGFVFIPLYFQGVMGLSPVQSGSAMIPMTLGVMLGSNLSGQLLARTGGHYRRHAIVGLALLAGGIWMLSRMGPDTSLTQALVSVTILGAGIGSINPVMTIAVQNAVPSRYVGVITSTNLFFRSIGGTFGLAIFGSVMSRRFAEEIAVRVPSELTLYLPMSDLTSLANNPQALVSPQAQAALQAELAAQGSQAAALYQPLLDSLRASLSAAISEVFLVLFGVVMLALLLSFFLKEIPLRRAN